MDYWAVCSHSQLGQACSAALSMSWRNSGGEVLSSRSVQGPAPVCVFQLCPFTVLTHSLCVFSQDRSDQMFLMPTPALATRLCLPASITLLGHSGIEGLLHLDLLLASAAVLLTELLCLHLQNGQSKFPQP